MILYINLLTIVLSVVDKYLFSFIKHSSAYDVYICYITRSSSSFPTIIYMKFIQFIKYREVVLFFFTTYEIIQMLLFNYHCVFFYLYASYNIDLVLYIL